MSFYVIKCIINKLASNMNKLKLNLYEKNKILILIITILVICCQVSENEFKTSDENNLWSYEIWLDKSIPYLREICHEIELQNPLSTTQKIIAARKYVRESYIFVEPGDEWFDNYAYNPAKVMETIYSWHQNPLTNAPARLQCQPASFAMASILYYMDLESRLAGFLTDDFDFVASHACLEVFNIETNKWELHDVQYDMHFLDSIDRHLLYAPDLVFGYMANIIPTNNILEGWENMSQYHPAEKLRDHYYEILAYRIPSTGYSVYINVDRISLDKTFPQNDEMKIVEFINYVYGYPSINYQSDGDIF